MGWFALKKGMNVSGPKVDIDQKDFAIVGLRKRGGESSCKSRSSRCFRKTSNAHKLWLMGEMVKLKIKAKSIPDRFTIWPNEMSAFPRRQPFMLCPGGQGAGIADEGLGGKAAWPFRVLV